MIRSVDEHDDLHRQIMETIATVVGGELENFEQPLWDYINDKAEMYERRCLFLEILQDNTANLIICSKRSTDYRELLALCKTQDNFILIHDWENDIT